MDTILHFIFICFISLFIGFIVLSCIYAVVTAFKIYKIPAEKRIVVLNDYKKRKKN